MGGKRRKDLDILAYLKKHKVAFSSIFLGIFFISMLILRLSTIPENTTLTTTYSSFSKQVVRSVPINTSFNNYINADAPANVTVIGRLRLKSVPVNDVSSILVRSIVDDFGNEIRLDITGVFNLQDFDGFFVMDETSKDYYRVSGVLSSEPKIMVSSIVRGNREEIKEGTFVQELHPILVNETVDSSINLSYGLRRLLIFS